jgi:glycosyltransferase involved in cell wall biosynthesis
MEEVYGIPPSRVVVAPYAVERRFAEEPPVASPAQPPYFLAVGNLQPRKNLVTLIAAMARLRRRHPHIPDRLVLAGQPAYLAAEVARVAAHHGAGGAVELLGYVSDDELVALLRSATALAYPSVYEGFGLPVVEAMAAGTPVLVSDIAVMREVAGDAAVFVSPRDPDAWADALAEVAADADLRSRLRAAGREREARYSWRACAESIVAALEGAARS